MRQPQQITPVGAKTTFVEVWRWGQELERLHARIAPRFARPEPRRRMLAYLKGIVSAIERKNGWQLAEHAGEARVDGMQRLLNSAARDEGFVRDDLRAYVLEQLGDPQAILVIDETSFRKRGENSAGVSKQHYGTTGQVENWQVGVFLAYISRRGHTLVDRELYIPLRWTQDRERCREAGIPEEVCFQTKCEQAQQMIERLWQAKIPFAWVVADTSERHVERKTHRLPHAFQPGVGVRIAANTWVESMRCLLPGRRHHRGFRAGVRHLGRRSGDRSGNRGPRPPPAP